MPKGNFEPQIRLLYNRPIQNRFTNQDRTDRCRSYFVTDKYIYVNVLKGLCSGKSIFWNTKRNNNAHNMSFCSSQLDLKIFQNQISYKNVLFDKV